MIICCNKLSPYRTNLIDLVKDKISYKVNKSYLLTSINVNLYLKYTMIICSLKQLIFETARRNKHNIILLIRTIDFILYGYTINIYLSD